MNSNMQSFTMNDGTVVEFEIGIDPDEAITGKNEVCTCSAWEPDECICGAWDNVDADLWYNQE